MKIFGLEIKRYVSKEEQIQECREVYYKYRYRLFYYWEIVPISYIFLKDVPTPWHVVGRSGRWILIGSASTKAHGCIKKPNYEALDEVCNRKPFYCYRFVSPQKLVNNYHAYPKHQ